MSEYVKKNIKIKKLTLSLITSYSINFLKRINVEYVVSNKGTVVKIDLDSLTDDEFAGEHIGTTKNEDIFKLSSNGWRSILFYPCEILPIKPKYINKDCK